MGIQSYRLKYGRFIVPLSGYAINRESYNLKVTVNDKDEYTTEEIVTINMGTGLEVSVKVGYSKIIIEPVEEVVPGWGRAFDFSDNTNGCNARNNKNKLALSILLCKSITKTGKTVFDRLNFPVLSKVLLPGIIIPVNSAGLEFYLS